MDRLRVGDRFLVRPGERVATDGTVVEGSSALDLSLISGESRPVEVGPGTAAVGGAVNSRGLLEVRADVVGADTQLARITRLVEDAQTGKTKVQRLADAVAAVFVPAVLTVSVSVLGFWLGAGADPQAAVTAAVAVLVVGAADVTLVREDLQAIADAVRLARRTLGAIRTNPVWAFGYNLVTVPLAAVGLLSPMWAAAAMSASSLLVVGNSLRLRGRRPGGPARPARRPHSRRTRPRGETS